MSERADWPARDCARWRELSNAWAAWLACVPWQFFVTLTFDPKWVFPVNAVLASKEAFWWCSQTARILRNPIGWLYAVERWSSGLWHAHALIAGVPGPLGEAPVAMWKEGNGRIDVRPIYAAPGATLYTTKQAALSGEVVFSDTLPRYRQTLTDGLAVSLYPVVNEKRRAPCKFGKVP